MAISVKHAFVSGKIDDVDATVVRASNWNEAHTLLMTTGKLLGRGTAADGAVEEITLGTNLALSGTTLNAANISNGDKGDVTVSGGGTTWTIDNDAVTYAKLQNASAASKLLGRGSASGAGDFEEITLGTNISMSGTTLNVALGGGVAAVIIPQGRLTLQTVVPVMTTTQSAKTTIYYTPHVGNQIGLYDGSSVVVTTFAEVSNLTAQSSTGKAGPAAVAANSVYDLFVWNDAGTVRLTRGPAWTNDTTRSAGTALVMVAGLFLNNATITNGPAASRGTYVGTVRSNASSQIDWIYGAVATNGTAGFFGVWNAYNRKRICTLVGDDTDSWTYSTATWRSSNASNTMRVSFVSGLAEDFFIGQNYQIVSLAGGAASIAIGYDSITSPSGIKSYVSGANSVPISSAFTAQSLGFHYFQALEYTASGTSTFNGDAGGTALQNGLLVEGMM